MIICRAESSRNWAGNAAIGINSFNRRQSSRPTAICNWFLSFFCWKKLITFVALSILWTLVCYGL